MDGIREMYRGVGLKFVVIFIELFVVRLLVDKMYDYFVVNWFRLVGRDESCNCKKKDWCSFEVCVYIMWM